MIASHEIQHTWQIKSVNAPLTLELRAIKDKLIIVKQFYEKDYQSTDDCCSAFEVEALTLNDRGFNIYHVMNPIKANALIGKACKAHDIESRDLLLIDIDRRDKTHPITGEVCPASNQELIELENVCDAIADYFKNELNEVPIAKVMSGNGYHLYFELGLPNDESSSLVVKQLLQQLENQFGTDTCEVDTSVYDPSRITKVLGCIARKGKESVDRPYRMAALCP
jgi:hypothetical protein